LARAACSSSGATRNPITAVKTGNAEYYDQNWNSIGANYYLDGQKLKVSFEYADISFDTEHPTNPALQDYNQATLGLQFIF